MTPLWYTWGIVKMYSSQFYQDIYVVFLLLLGCFVTVFFIWHYKSAYPASLCKKNENRVYSKLLKYVLNLSKLCSPKISANIDAFCIQIVLSNGLIFFVK